MAKLTCVLQVLFQAQPGQAPHSFISSPGAILQCYTQASNPRNPPVTPQSTQEAHGCSKKRNILASVLGNKQTKQKHKPPNLKTQKYLEFCTRSTGRCCPVEIWIKCCAVWICQLQLLAALSCVKTSQPASSSLETQTVFLLWTT